MEKKSTKVKDEKQYRGVDVNVADNNKVTQAMVDKDVAELNNNPRNEK